VAKGTAPCWLTRPQSDESATVQGVPDEGATVGTGVVGIPVLDTLYGNGVAVPSRIRRRAGAAADRKLAELKDAYVSTLESELVIVKGFDSLIQSAKPTLNSLENPKGLSSSSTVVYWQDKTGEHSFSTEKHRVS
jgi:hypothetical protein